MPGKVDNVDKAVVDLAAGRYRSLRRAAFVNKAPLSTLSARLNGRPKRANIDLSS
jgi:hypothetical protein